MALTITIPGAVETTTGSTAPAVLTVGVGSPGVGVPSGGTTGQVLQKLSGVSYDTGWLTLPADFITSVTSPLAVAAGVLSVDLSAYSTTAQAAALYYPLSGNPSAFITASALTPYATIASPTFTGVVTIPSGALISGYLTTADAASTYYLQTNPDGFITFATLSPYALLASPTFTGSPSLPTGTIGVTQTALDSTTALATTAFVTTADNLKANLASPTFTGTPSLPTGSIGVTQSPGNNTTALATTAFVTAAVPAVPTVATFAESQQLTSATAFMSPFDTLMAMMTEGYRPALGMTGGSTGTGAGVNPIMPQYMGIGGPNTLTAGSCHAITNNSGGYSTASTSTQTIKWNKPACISGTFSANGASVGEANNEFKIFLGTSMLNGNDPTSASIGLFKLGGTTPISVMVHDGTTLTKVASSSSFGGTTPVRYLVYSDGNGNVTLYINGTSVATTTLGPTGSTQTNIGQFTASIKQTATAVTKYYIDLIHPKIFVAPQ